MRNRFIGRPVTSYCVIWHQLKKIKLAEFPFVRKKVKVYYDAQYVTHLQSQKEKWALLIYGFITFLLG